jgi:hypothetical protein
MVVGHNPRGAISATHSYLLERVCSPPIIYVGVLRAASWLATPTVLPASLAVAACPSKNAQLVPPGA